MNTSSMSSQWLHRPMANLLILIPMVCWFAFCLDIIAPALPVISDEFHVSSSLLQNSMSLFLLICGIMQLSIRTLVMKLGRHSVTLGCYISVIVGCLIGAKANNHIALILARCLQAAGSSGTLMIGFISVKDITDNKAIRATIYSLLSTSIALSPILIPMLGAFILETNHWHYTFTCMLILISLHGIIMLKMFPRAPSQDQSNNQQKSAWSDLFSDHANLAYLLSAGILGGAANFLFLSHSSYIYIVNFETSRLLYSYFYCSVGITYMIGCFSFPYVAKCLNNIQTIILGHMLVFTSMVLTFILSQAGFLNAYTFTFFAAIAHVGSGFLLTGSIIGLMNEPKLGTDQVIGMYGCAKFILPAMFGWISMSYGASLFSLSSSIIILSVLVLLALMPIFKLNRSRISNAY